MNVFYESLSIRESMVLKDKDVIREVNGFHLALIMNYLWMIDLYLVTTSNGHFKFLEVNYIYKFKSAILIF